MTLDLEPHRVEAGQTYPNIGIYSFGRGTFAKAGIDAASTSASTLYRVRAGQIIYSRLFAFEGAYASVSAEHDGAFVSNEFPTFTVDPDQVDPGYIAWLFRWHGTWRSLRAGAVGMGDRRQRVHPDRVLRHRILLPPLAEQRRTIMRLDAAAAAMEARITAAGELKAELAAMLAAAFDRITRDAPRSTMGEVAPLVRRPVMIDPDATYPELGVRSFGKGTFHKPPLAGIDVGSKKLFSIEPADLVFNIVFAWEGAVAVAEASDVGRVGSHRFLSCVPDPSSATATFLRYWFLSEEGLLALGRASPGGAGRNRTLGIKGLEAIRVPVPSLDAQHWFDRLQTKVRAARMAQAAATAELDALLPALLHDAFGDADARD
jgi:type I restriction enzyme S subunit